MPQRQCGVESSSESIEPCLKSEVNIFLRNCFYEFFYQSESIVRISIKLIPTIHFFLVSHSLSRFIYFVRSLSTMQYHNCFGLVTTFFYFPLFDFVVLYFLVLLDHYVSFNKMPKALNSFIYFNPDFRFT